MATFSNTPLSLADILRTAPSILADSKHESRGKHYGFISTHEMLDAMHDRGFMPFSVHQTNPRKDRASREGFTKHAIAFRHESTFANNADTVPQIVILNSHDGTCTYKLYAGIFRFICSNGLIVGDTISAYSIAHRDSKALMANIIDASFQVLDDAIRIGEVISDWKAIELSNSQRMDMATMAHALKFGDRASEYLDVIRPEALLTPHNAEDDGNNSLWSTYNVLQENIIKGGLGGTAKNGRRIRTRSINNVMQNLNTNKGLWNIASDMASNIITL